MGCVLWQSFRLLLPVLIPERALALERSSMKAVEAQDTPALLFDADHTVRVCSVLDK